MGVSSQHRHDILQVYNKSSGHITTRFHVVSDDKLLTVESILRESDPSSHWEELSLENSWQVPVDDPYLYVDNEWLTNEERELK
jgi:hypothetical protein